MTSEARCKIIGTTISCTTYEKAVSTVFAWARDADYRYVCAANVHMVMEAYDDPVFQSVVNGAGLVAPDGMPLVWGMRLLGIKEQERIYGPSLTLLLCESAAREGIPIGLYGGTEESLSKFQSFLARTYPGIRIACSIAPPFRQLTDAEDTEYTRMLAESGARIVFVGIGCPKQEKWMAAHRGRIPAVMVGVGAAFDFYSGSVKQAPVLLQKYGMEWFFRLIMEPKRLWKRYLKHNPRFLALFLIQLMQHSLQAKRQN